MNPIFFHMAGHKKCHQTITTKTLETNVTSDKGEEKSKSNSQTSNQTNNLPKKKNNLYLLQYQKYFNKKLVIKYNILPNEYTLMKLDNFISAKYCHSLASFKEKLIFNYDEEFLNRFYPKKISYKKIPLFSEFYKSYLKFFCFPTLAELRLNELIEDMVEKKAKAFYNENFTEKKDKNDKKINCIIFTNKIRQDISRSNSLSNLTKTTIKNHSTTNKSSSSLLTIEKIFNELNNEKKINNNSKNKLKNNNSINSINKGLKNSVILHKIKKKIKTNFKDKDSTNISSKIKNNTTTDCASSGKRQKIKNKISKNLQNILLENKTSTLNNQKISTIQKSVHSILKINSKINFSKNIYSTLENQKITSSNNSKNNSKNALTERNKIKELKNNNKIFKNHYNTLSIKNNTIISNFNNINHNSNLKIHNTNFNTLCTNNVNNNNKNLNSIIHKTIPNGANNNIIKVIQKSSIQKMKQIKQIKSRNYKNNINDINGNANRIYSTHGKNELILKNLSKENISDYYTINNKNVNTISMKLTNQKSKPKIKLIKAENINTNKNNNNAKVFNFITTHKKNTNNYLSTNNNRINGSSFSSQKNMSDKKLCINTNIRKNRVIDSKNQTQISTNSYVLNDSQKPIKNLKIITNLDNSKNMMSVQKVKINKKDNESSIGNDYKVIKTIKSYCKK